MLYNKLRVLKTFVDKVFIEIYIIKKVVHLGNSKS